MQSPLDYTALPLVTRWGPVEVSREPGKKRVHYMMNVATNPALVDGADNHLAMEFVALAKTPDGKAVDHPVIQRLDLHPTSEHLATIRAKGISYLGTLDILPGEYTVRFVVRDDLSGRVGSVAAPWKVE